MVLICKTLSLLHVRMLCAKLVEIGWVVLEKKSFHQCIFVILLLSPLVKGHGPSFEQTWIPFTHGYFVVSLVEIGPGVLEKMEIWNGHRWTDREMDDRWTEKLTWAFRPGELKMLYKGSMLFKIFSLTICINSLMVKKKFRFTELYLFYRHILYQSWGF